MAHKHPGALKTMPVKDKPRMKDPKSFSKPIPGKKTEPDVTPVSKRPGAAALARKLADKKL